MTTSAIILSAILGLIISALETYLGSRLSKKVKISHWFINLVLGALGSVAATQLLPGAYGPMFAGVSLIPSIVGSLVLAGIGTWCVNHFSK